MPKKKLEEGTGNAFAPGAEPTLKIRCKVYDSVSLDEFEDLQDEFKFMSMENAAKLRHELETIGFCQPVTVWFNKGKYYILDGDKRVGVIKGMVKDGWKLEGDSLPVSVVEADDKKMAKRMVMALTSNYGTVSKKGYKRMVKDAGMTEDEAQNCFNFPDLVVSAKAPAKKKKVEFEAGEKEKTVECPKCHHIFDPNDDIEEEESE